MILFQKFVFEKSENGMDKICWLSQQRYLKYTL